MHKYIVFDQNFYNPDITFVYDNKRYQVGTFILLIMDQSKAKRLNQEQYAYIKKAIEVWNKKYNEWHDSYFKKLIDLVRQDKISHQELGRTHDTHERIAGKFNKIVSACINGNVYFWLKRYAEERGFEFFEQHPGFIESELDAIIKQLKI